MPLTGVPCFVMLTILFLFVARIHAPELNQSATCGSVEVCYLNLASATHSITCNCTNAHCWWSTFAHPENILSSGTNEAVLMLMLNEYGQYICKTSNGTVARNILILPEGENIIKSKLY